MHPYHLVHMPEDPGEPYPKRWIALMFMCCAVLVSGFDMTVTNVALPEISKALHASPSDLQIIVDAYAIVFAGLLLFGSGLADRYGRKGAFVGGLLLFAAASFDAAFADSVAHLAADRIVMGLGAALFLPPTMSILTVLFPKGERAKAVGVWAAFGGAGVALGPIIAGLLLERFWWGSVFFLTVPIAVTAAIGAIFFVPTSRRPQTPRLDWVGALLSVAGLGVFLYGIIIGPDRGWVAAGTLVPLGVGLALIVGFILWEMHTPDPMFQVRVFSIRELDAGALALFLLYLTFMGLLFVVPTYLQKAEGASPLRAGLLMAPLGLSFAFASPFSARVYAKFGIRRTLVGGVLLMTVGLTLMAFLPTIGDLVVIIGGIFYGLGIATTMPPASTVVINALPVEQAGDGADVNLVSRQVGGAFGVAVIGSIYASMLVRSDMATAATVALSAAAGVALIGAITAGMMLRPAKN